MGRVFWKSFFQSSNYFCNPAPCTSLYLRCFKPSEIWHVACGNTFIVCVCEHSRPFSSDGLRPNCLPSRCHTQQPPESRAGAGEQTTIPPAGPEGVCLPQVPGAVQLGWVQRKGWRGGEKRAMASVHYPNLTCLLPRFLRDLEISHKTAFTSPCTIRPSLWIPPSLLYRWCQNSLVGQNCYSQKIV